jgi:hypothetical protein
MLRRAGILWPDGNSLRRRADRIESVIMAGLLAVLLLAVPAAAFAAGSLADHATRGEARAEQTWHQVTATFTSHGTPRLEPSASGMSLPSARARWTDGGQVRTGWVPVDPTAPHAQTAVVWVNAAGAPTGTPAALSALHLAVALAGLAGALLAGFLVFLAGVTARVALDRKRIVGWERAWQTVGPQWSRQL